MDKIFDLYNKYFKWILIAVVGTLALYNLALIIYRIIDNSCTAYYFYTNLLTYALYGFLIYALFTNKTKYSTPLFVILCCYYIYVAYRNGLSGITSLSSNDAWNVICNIVRMLGYWGALGWAVMTVLYYFFKKDVFKFVRRILALVLIGLSVFSIVEEIVDVVRYNGDYWYTLFVPFYSIAYAVFSYCLPEYLENLKGNDTASN